MSQNNYIPLTTGENFATTKKNTAPCNIAGMIVNGTYFLAEEDRREGLVGLGEKETRGQGSKRKRDGHSSPF